MTGRLPAKRLGDYEVVSWLATGGMAEVYLARRQGAYGFQKHVALKCILPQYAEDAEFVSMFVDEARVGAALSHPNLVEVFDFGEGDGELYIAMEYVEGTTAAKLVRAAAQRGEVVPFEDTLYLVLSVLRGLDFAHNATRDDGSALALVHRDVSPGNVLLSRTGSVKLADFGIARAADIDRRTEHGQMKGKLGYMSPEQVSGRELDARSDLFTLGIVFAELLVGRPMFAQGQEIDILVRIRDADTSVFSRHAGALPEDLAAIVYKALAREPADRFQSAAAFADALEEFARRRRLSLGPARLAAYLEHLGLIRPTSRSGEYRLGVPVTGAVRASRVPPPPAPTEGAPAVSYAVRLPSGDELGPLALGRLIELVVAGDVPHDAEVAKDGGAFTPARDHAELRRLTTSSAHRWDSEPDGEGERWAISRATLPARLYRLGAARVTGVLRAQSGGQRKKVYLVDGQVEYATSTEAGELLGALLLDEQLVLPVELDMALAMAPRFGGRVGDALVALGILRPIDVFRALYEQLRLRVSSLLVLGEGALAFRPGHRSHEESLPQPLPLLELVTRGVAQRYPDEEIAALLAPLMHEPVSPGPRTAPGTSSLGLSAERASVVAAFERPRTIAEVERELASAGVSEPADTRFAAFIALSSGLLVAHGSAISRVAAPGW
ncbi:MAG: serine/threonine protein kinase [Polyangiaceae bacterium]|nr:serine/threonine protein kinase [Polyangiaceae bacterium]